MSHDIILHNATNDSLKEFLSANLLLGEVRKIITAHGASAASAQAAAPVPAASAW